MAADVAQLSKAGFTARDIGDEISVSDGRLGVGAEAIIPGGFPVSSLDSLCGGVRAGDFDAAPSSWSSSNYFNHLLAPLDCGSFEVFSSLES